MQFYLVLSLSEGAEMILLGCILISESLSGQLTYCKTVSLLLLNFFVCTAILHEVLFFCCTLCL